MNNGNSNLFQKDCPKGELDKKQFTNVFKEFYPQGKAEKFSASIFNVFDTGIPIEKTQFHLKGFNNFFFVNL